MIVALDLPPNEWINREARARNWRLLNLRFCSYIIPKGMTPHGALVQQLADQVDVRNLLAMGCKAIRLGQLPNPADDILPAVLPDTRAEGRLAAEHFAERGFSDVCFFGADPWSDGEVLFKGFRDHAEQLGMACHLYQFAARKNEPWDEREARKLREHMDWLQRVPKPVGLLSYSDVLAIRSTIWALHAGYKVPDEVAILARGNDHQACEYSLPTISYIDTNLAGRMRVACDLLDRLMAGETGPKEAIMVPPSGIAVNESTSILATPDPKVAAALRYMWEHLDRDLAVEDIAREVALSERQLNRHFHKALGRSVNKEMKRKRLEEAKRLLRTTDLPIAELGPMVGFRSVGYLHRTFLAVFGMTPGQYRQESR